MSRTSTNAATSAPAPAMPPAAAAAPAAAPTAAPAPTSRPTRARRTAQPAAPMGSGPHAQETEDRRVALSAFLRALARRVEQDPAFARTLLAVYAESSASPPVVLPQPQSAATGTRERTRRAAVVEAAPPAPALDPFALLREHGEAGLRERLSHLELPALRAILRAHRLDPARIAARWTARERIADLIVEQVRARSSLGRAFERV